MRLNRPQRVVVVLTALVVAAMCLYPAWEVSWTFDGAGERIGVCYAPLWSEPAAVLRRASSKELSILQAKYNEEAPRQETMYRAWQEEYERRRDEWRRARAKVVPTSDPAIESTAESWKPGEAWTKASAAGQERRDEEEAVRKALGPCPRQAIFPTVKANPLWNLKLEYVRLVSFRLYLGLAVAGAVGAAAFIVCGFLKRGGLA